MKKPVIQRFDYVVDGVKGTACCGPALSEVIAGGKRVRYTPVGPATYGKCCHKF